VERAAFAQTQVIGTPEHDAAIKIADSLYTHLATVEPTALIVAANQPGRSSADIQAVFLQYALDLGFTSEAKGLFADYLSSALRPDYYLQLGDTGILLEVERGKTTITTWTSSTSGNATSAVMRIT
jgi:hypothetical protein